MKTEVWLLGEELDLGLLQKAAEYIKSGKLVVFPTETVYGIGALPTDEALLQKIYELKGRPETKPFAWHLAGTSDIARLDLAPNPLFEKTAAKFYPAPFTSLVKTKNGEMVGVRIPQDRIISELIRLCGGALLATSANLSGKPSATCGAMALSYFEGQVDLVLDSGETQYSGDSTVIDFTAQPFKILRPGVYSQLEEEIRKL